MTNRVKELEAALERIERMHRDYDPLSARGITAEIARTALNGKPDSENVCEHGDHHAPEGRRFCSITCLRCEHDSTGPGGCDGICSSSELDGRPLGD